MNTDSAEKELVPFLRRLADAIEHKKLSVNQLQHIGEFFMSYLFIEQVEKDNLEYTKKSEKHPTKFSDEEFKKFITLGWWVYSEIDRLGITS